MKKKLIYGAAFLIIAYIIYKKRFAKPKIQAETPEQKAKRNGIIEFARMMYKSKDTNSTTLTNNELYEQLLKMPDADFIAVSNEYAKYLEEAGKNGTMRRWLDDNSQTMESYNKISDRLNELEIE